MNQTLLEKDLFIFDMDGTIYLGERVFPFAVDFINALRAHGKRVLFFTNNASHNNAFYLQKLTRLGFSPQREEIMSSGNVTIAFLRAHRQDKQVYLVGTPELEAMFSEAGIRLVSETATSADIVVTSFDTTLTYEKLCAACRLIRGGAEYLSTHSDFNCPTESGFIPDSGAIAALISASTGAVPRYFGKPYEDTVSMICEMTGTARKDMCIFGDRLYTDIALGRKYGVTAVLVLTGETTAAQVQAADAADCPDFIYPSLAEVHAAMFDELENTRR